VVLKLLKHDLGEGYTVQVSLSVSTSPPNELLHHIRTLAPHTHMSLGSPQPLYHLKSKDTVVVDRVLRLLDRESGKCSIVSYDVLGTSIEDIFLELMRKVDAPEGGDEIEKSIAPLSISFDQPKPVALNLAIGRATSLCQQAWTIFYKRSLILRRSRQTPLMTVVIAVASLAVPLVFTADLSQACVKTVDVSDTDIFLFPPTSPILAVYGDCRRGS
jgi:hypothetical protein